MTTYTLHIPDDALPGDPDALERAQVVPDGFSWAAFFFTALWFFAHRLWVAGLAVLAHVLLALLSGLEANALRRWTYARRGRPAVEAVSAANAEEATLKLYEAWLGGARPARSTSAAAPRPAYAAPDAVIGLFPDAERGR